MDKYQIDEIIDLMKKFTTSKDNGELGEQDAAPAGGATGGGGGGKAGYPTVTKWESGVTRGPANQIGNTKWRDIVKITRGKANTLL
jgi:hypothetical protein